MRLFHNQEILAQPLSCGLLSDLDAAKGVGDVAVLN